MRPLRLQVRDRLRKLEEVREADAAHTEVMERVAARGGITLEELRHMSMPQKDAFISKHRDRS